MAKRSTRIIFFYLLVPAIFVIFVYSFMFARFSNLSHLHANYRPGQLTNEAYHSVLATTDRPESESGNGTVINALDDYLHLDLNPKNTTFWSAKLDRQYRRTLSQSQFPLKVIIVPHSHNDPGWLNTYDQYYYRFTYYILDNMVKNLNKYPNMTFIWPEMSFFSRWWYGLPSDAARRKVKSLLESKRFEIVTGGWVMTDEAASHYVDMLEQLIEGHQFLKTTLNYKPTNSWSIDPFGHSGTMPYFLKKSGIHNMYIQRTHFAWKQRLSETRSLEFFWRQFFENSSQEKPVMCHMSPLDLYSFKYACGPDISTCLNFDFRKIFGESSESTAVELNRTNIDLKAHEILAEYAKLGSMFPHNVALVLLGDDFRYDLDTEWRQQYDNYNLLMNYVNSNGAKFHQTHIQFGTLQDYFEAVNARIPIEPTSATYPSLFGDFIPYADVYVSAVPNYWTGYYSTRPFYKELSRELQHWLRSAEILFSLCRNRLRTYFGVAVSQMLDRHYAQIASARQNLSLFQHHDGITGTSRDFVMEDYGRRMAHSVGKMMELAALCIQLLNAHNIHSSYNLSKPFVFAHQHKPSWNRITERRLLRVPAGESGLKLVLFNTHLQKRTETVRILVEDPFVKVLDVENNARVDVQVNPVFSGHQLSSNTFELEFTATLYPLSLKNYKVLTNEESIQAKVTIVEHNMAKTREEANANRLTSTSNNNNNNEVFRFEKSSSLYLENDLMRIEFNRAGFIERLRFKDSNTTEQVEMSFAAYHSKPTKSGAYLFKASNADHPEKLFITTTPQISLFRGKASSTLLVNYSDIAYSVKLHNAPTAAIGAAVELKVLVDLTSEYSDREVVLRITTPIRNVAPKKDGQVYRTFYVDSNGFTMLQRNFIPSTGVEGNYYPMTTAIFIEDASSRLTVLSSSSHGVTSPADGTIEIMLDRRIIEDDKRGLSQGITDNLPVELSFWLVFEQRAHLPHPPLPNNDYLGKLSSLADSLFLQLNYPSVVTYSYKSDREVGKESTNYFLNQYLIAPDLLCEYFLLNLRTLPVAASFSHPSNSSLLLLHNRASSSSDQWQPHYAVGHRCDNSSAALLSKQGLHLFNGLRVASVEATSLTGLQSRHRLESLSQIEVAPFEINSYTINFS